MNYKNTRTWSRSVYWTCRGIAVLASLAFAQDMSNGADNFYKSDKVEVKRVTFPNQYNMGLVGHLFTPKNLAKETSWPQLSSGIRWEP